MLEVLNRCVSLRRVAKVVAGTMLMMMVGPTIASTITSTIASTPASTIASTITSTIASTPASTIASKSAIGMNAEVDYASIDRFGNDAAVAGSVNSAIDRAMAVYKKSDRRWLEVRLETQRVVAWEGKTPVYAVIVSTGKASTPTPKGVFEVQEKYRFARMQGADYDVPDVPYTMYYFRGYAIHGAYWHSNFGTPVSHGCVNLAVDQAKWFYNWAAVGTPVVVH